MKQQVLSYDRSRLFEQITSYESLYEGFRMVKKNKGAPGVDGATVDQFESDLDKELTQLQQELQEWCYKPQPVRRVEIAKPNGGVRKLGIPNVRDRVVQASIKRALEPIFEPEFSESSFGFRPGRSQQMAVKRAQEIVKSGKKWVVDIDLAQFFDRIHHDRLIHRLKQCVPDNRVLRLIGMTLRSGVMVSGVVVRSDEGSVQGSPLSPLLSNIVLDELDKELESRGHDFCRFADDCNIFVKTERAAERVMATISQFIETKLKLKINCEKSKVALSKAVKFLGMTIVGTAIAISKPSMAKAMLRVKELTPRRTHLPLEKSIERINRWYVGWSNYHKMTQFSVQLNDLEAHIRRRLRAQLVAHHRKPKSLYKQLIKRGIKERRAKVAFSNNGVWAMSITRAVNTAWKNDWFHANLGLHTVFTEWQPHWFKRNRWPRLA